MNIRRYRSLHAAGGTYAEIARACGVDWRTVKKYLATDAPVAPPSPVAGRDPAAGDHPELETVIRSWLAKDIELKASVIHERLRISAQAPPNLADIWLGKQDVQANWAGRRGDCGPPAQ